MRQRTRSKTEALVPKASAAEASKSYLFDVHIYDMGKYSFKGIADQYSVLQVNLATLSGRTAFYPKELVAGKASKVQDGRGLVEVRSRWNSTNSLPFVP